MKKTLLLGLGAVAMAIGSASVALFQQKVAIKEADAALDATYVYFKTPWNNETSDVHVWNTNEDATNLPLTKAADNIWKIARSSISGYANFIIRATAGKWDDGQTGDLKYSLFTKADFVEVQEDSTTTYRWSLYCTKNSWSENSNYCLTFNNASEVKITDVSISKDDTMKIVRITDDGSSSWIDEGYWYGYTTPLNKSASSDAGKFTNDASDNIVAKEDGVFSFFFNMSGGTNSIWITDADKVAIDGWATGFIGVTDFCDVGDTDWDTYAGYYSALSAKAKSYFIGATADPEGNNVAKAAARYDNAVANHGKTPFATGGSRAGGALKIPALPMSNGDNNLASVIVVASVAAISTIGATFFFVRARKRRE